MASHGCRVCKLVPVDCRQNYLLVRLLPSGSGRLDLGGQSWFGGNHSLVRACRPMGLSQGPGHNWHCFQLLPDALSGRGALHVEFHPWLLASEQTARPCPISEEIAIGTFVSASKSFQLRLTTGRRVVSPCTPVRAIEVDGWGTGAPSVSSSMSRPELTIEWSAPLSSKR